MASNDRDSKLYDQWWDRQARSLWRKRLSHLWSSLLWWWSR